MKIISSLFLSFCIALISACTSPDTSVDNVPVASGDVPAEYIGVYSGSISGETTAKKATIVKDSFNEILTITVRSDNTISFSSDFSDKVLTTKIGGNGGFNDILDVNQDGCTGSVNISGLVNSTTASGQIGGSGKCDGTDVAITGSFTATK